MMKTVVFAVTLPDGIQKIAGVSELRQEFLDAAKTARANGFVKIDGEAVPIIGGSVFSNLPVQEVYSFRCDAAVKKAKR